MEQVPPPSKLVRFGTFAVDFRAGELRKNGIKLKLSGQPFQILTILLERPGDIVTRDELQKCLWPDTFVDVDHNLNAAINKIREALSDAADTPRFVETIPRRGYRFIGEIRAEHRDVADSASIALPASWLKWLVGLVAVGIVGLFVIIAARSRSHVLQAPRVLGYTQLTKDALSKAVLNFPWSIQLVTNGPRIYFSQAASGLDSHLLGEISSTSMPDGSTGSIRVPFEWPIPTGVSPDGSQLLATAGMDLWDRPLWLVSLPSGTSRRLGALVGHDASWSPDGRSIVFAKDHELYRTDSGGNAEEKLATLANGVATCIRWSPDGGLLRFTVTDDFTATNSASLWQISSAGVGLERLLPEWTDSSSQECCGDWTADGKHYIFQATRDGVTGIWAIRDGPRRPPSPINRPVQLTTGPIRFTAPLPSKDGRRIFAIGEQLRGQLTKFDPESHRFVRYLSGISAEQLNFSADGQWVTYITYPESLLWRSRIDGSQRQQLTVSPLQAAAPRWSPKGQQIVFAGYMPGEKFRLYVIPSEGGRAEAITASSNDQPAVRGLSDPQWSPDAKSVIYSEVSDLGLDGTSRLLSLDLQTRQVSPMPASQGLFSPRWSPDGRYVVAITCTGRNLMLFDSRTRKWSELVSGKSIGWPEWSRDSKYVSYVDFEPMAHIRVEINDRKVERVADLEQARGLNAGRFSSYYGLAPDGSLLSLQNTGIQEIYALDVKFP